MKNPAHLDNFKSAASSRYAILDVTSCDVRGTVYHEFASGKTPEQAKERFYSRFMFRDCDREMMNLAQKHKRLVLVKIEGIHRTTVEYDLLLLATL